MTLQAEEDKGHQLAVVGYVAAAVLFGFGVTAVKGSDSVRAAPRTPPPPPSTPNAAAAPPRAAGLPALAPQGAEFFAGYLLEQSLSVDNLFVFILMFSYFQVPAELEAKVLNYGIYGAAILRAGFIRAPPSLSWDGPSPPRPARGASRPRGHALKPPAPGGGLPPLPAVLGAELLENFRPVLLLFAALLVYSAGKILVGGDEEEDEDLEKNFIVATTRRVLPVSAAYDGDRFFTLIDGEPRAAAPQRLRG